MITITKKPYPCTFSKNPIELHVKSNMQFPTPLVMPYLEIEVLSKANAGTNITFEFTNPETREVHYVNIVAASFPEFPNEINTGNLSGTLQQYAAACAARLREYAPLNAWYDITSANKLIFIRAKYATDDLVIKNLQSNDPVTHFIFRNHVEWANPDEREGYTLKAIVYYENEYLSDQFKMVANLNCFIDNDGTAMIDVSNVIDAEIEAGMDHFPVPTNQQHKLDLLRRWYVEFVEYWNDNPNAIKTLSEVFFTHWGGVSRNDQLIGNPVALLQQQRQFLTWRPSGKELFQKQKDWLSWMNTVKDGNYRFVLTIGADSGVTTYNLPLVALKRWESMCRPVGYTQMDIPGFVSGSNVAWWSFQVLDADTDNTFVSPEFRYYLGESRCFHTEALVWNSFGAAETISFIEVIETQEISSNMVDQSQLFNNHRWKPDMFIFESKHRNSLVCETTRLGKQEAYRLQSTLNSYMSMIWQGNRWVPAVISVEKKNVLIESELTTSLEFEMIVANSSDRASFFKATPKLTVIESCGISQVAIDTQGLDIDDFGQLHVLDESGNDIGITGTYVPGTATYDLDTTIQTSGLYSFVVTVLDFDSNPFELVEMYQYNLPIVQFTYSNTGFLTFALTSISSGTEYIDVNWGIGMLFQTGLPYTGTATNFSENITDTGLKLLKLRKPCFGDIIRFETSNIVLVDSPFQYFTGLRYLVVSNADWNRKLILNGLSDMREIILTSCNLTGIEIGLMPMLKKLHIITSPLFTSDSIDEVIYEIWTMRKHFISSGGYLDVQFLSGTSMTFSAYALKMINGTDEFTGEGLNSDYNFTFTIS